MKKIKEFGIICKKCGIYGKGCNLHFNAHGIVISCRDCGSEYTELNADTLLYIKKPINTNDQTL
jgi:RNase P subunit RPR2